MLTNMYCRYHGECSAKEIEKQECFRCISVGQTTKLYTVYGDMQLPVIAGDVRGDDMKFEIPKEKEMQTSGVKYDQGKPAFELIPPHMEEEVAKALSYGATKYGPDNWKKVGGAKRRYYGAFRRHMNAHKRGELRDPESGLLHVAHAVASLMFLGEFELAGIPEVSET